MGEGRARDLLHGIQVKGRTGAVSEPPPPLSPLSPHAAAVMDTTVAQHSIFPASAFLSPYAG